MRILFVTTSTARGGAERVLYDSASFLKQKGHEVKVVSLKPAGVYARKLEEKGMETISLNMGYFPTGRELKKLEKIIEDYRPDIVHAFLYRAIQMCRVVKKDFFKLVTAPHADYKNKNSFLVFLDAVLKKYDDVSLCESRSTYNFLTAAQHYNKEKVKLLLNAAGAEFKENPRLRNKARKELKAGDKTVFLCAARLEKGKGHAVLLDAFSSFYARNKNVVLWLCGGGKEEKKLKTRCKKNGITDGVLFLGERDDMAALYNGADCFVFSSEAESRPMALVEAAACNLPAITSPAGDSADIYENGKTGFVFPASDAVSLACFMEEAASGGRLAEFKESLRAAPRVKYGEKLLKIYHT